MARGLFGATLADAWITLRSHPGRALVSASALMCGAASLAVLLASLGSLQRQADRMVKDLGVDVFAAVATGEAGPSDALTLRHAEVLAGLLSDALVSATRRHDRAFSTGRDQITVIQTDDRYTSVRQRSVLAGRFVDQADLRTRDRVVVLPRALAIRLQLGVGETLRLRETPFRVIGILEDGAPYLPGDAPLSERASEELAVFTPITTPAYWNAADSRPGRVDALFVRALRGRVQDVQARARQVLGQSLNPDALLWVTPATLLRKVERMQSVVRWSAGATTLLSMFMGGGIIFALMIASVRERVSEIGLRRSLGATREAVAVQFVAESALIAAVAAVAGCALANGGLWALQDRLPLPLQADAISWLAPVVATLLVAMLGTLPACMLAARISPADALRGE